LNTTAEIIAYIGRPTIVIDRALYMLYFFRYRQRIRVTSTWNGLQRSLKI